MKRVLFGVEIRRTKSDLCWTSLEKRRSIARLACLWIKKKNLTYEIENLPIHNGSTIFNLAELLTFNNS